MSPSFQESTPAAWCTQGATVAILKYGNPSCQAALDWAAHQSTAVNKNLEV